MFQDVPALELPEGYSVLDEYRLVNDHDPNWSKARLMHKQADPRLFHAGSFPRPSVEIIRLLLARKEKMM
jgi:oleate hydratase